MTVYRQISEEEKEQRIFLLHKSEQQESHCVVAEVVFRGEPQFRKYFLVQKYFELYPNIDLKLPFITRKASLEITKAPAFQTPLENIQTLILVAERVKGEGKESPRVLCWDSHTLFALLQLPLQWLSRFLPYVREYKLMK